MPRLVAARSNSFQLMCILSEVGTPCHYSLLHNDGRKDIPYNTLLYMHDFRVHIPWQS